VLSRIDQNRDKDFIVLFDNLYLYTIVNNYSLRLECPTFEKMSNMETEMLPFNKLKYDRLYNSLYNLIEKDEKNVTEILTKRE